jgi:hypothetical protein
MAVKRYEVLSLSSSSAQAYTVISQSLAEGVVLVGCVWCDIEHGWPLCVAT